MNQVNYQKELEKILNTLQEKARQRRITDRPACFCIAAVHRAAVIVWNICAVIF